MNFSAPTGQYTRANRISMEGHAGLGVEERGAQTCVENPPFDWKRGPEPVIGVFLPVIEVSFVKTCTRVSRVSSLSIAGPGAFAAAPAPRLRIEEAVVQHAGLLEK